MKPFNFLAAMGAVWASIAWPVSSTFLPPRDLGFNHTREYTLIGTNYYSYLQSVPAGMDPIGTVVLVHGFPDLSYGWRYQIPFLTSLGYRVVAPDMLGYGRSRAPRDLRQFSLKSMSDDLAKLVRRIAGDEQVILGGHDWGGALVYRAALWHPELFRGIFSVCTPYTAPVPEYVDLKDQIEAGITPSFGYQLQFRDSAIDSRLRGATNIRRVLLALYGATTPSGDPGFDARTGLIFENLPHLGASPLVSNEDLDYYTVEYLKNTITGPFSWYRTARINFDEELALVDEETISFPMPGLYIGATKDTALPPEMSIGMEKYFDAGLTRGEVDSSHWALWQAAKDVNSVVGEWISTLG